MEASGKGCGWTRRLWAAEEAAELMLGQQHLGRWSVENQCLIEGLQKGPPLHPTLGVSRLLFLKIVLDRECSWRSIVC